MNNLWYVRSEERFASPQQAIYLRIYFPFYSLFRIYSPDSVKGNLTKHYPVMRSPTSHNKQPRGDADDVKRHFQPRLAQKVWENFDMRWKKHFGPMRLKFFLLLFLIEKNRHFRDHFFLLNGLFCPCNDLSITNYTLFSICPRHTKLLAE
jgi:hypothetical protein